MKRHKISIIIIGIIVFIGVVLILVWPAKVSKIITSNNQPPTPPGVEFKPEDAQRLATNSESDSTLRARIIEDFIGKIPAEWSEKATGVKLALDTQDKVIALTFDADGGPNGSGYDKNLIDYLRAEKIPATLFITSRWIDANPDTFKTLASDPLFEIENHGTKHMPCSVSDQSAYGISGTKNAGEIVDEIELNARKIAGLTGKKPQFYRAGTAYTDEICPKIAEVLGEKVVNYSLLGDAGATFTAPEIRNAFAKAKPGDIALLHMNQPTKDTAAGIKLAVPELKAQGFRFVKLSDYSLK